MVVLRTEQGRAPASAMRGDFPWSYTREWESGDPTRERGRRQSSSMQEVVFATPRIPKDGKSHLSVQHHISSTVPYKK